MEDVPVFILAWMQASPWSPSGAAEYFAYSKGNPEHGPTDDSLFWVRGPPIVCALILVRIGCRAEMIRAATGLADRSRLK